MLQITDVQYSHSCPARVLTTNSYNKGGKEINLITNSHFRVFRKLQKEEEIYSQRVHITPPQLLSLLSQTFLAFYIFKYWLYMFRSVDFFKCTTDKTAPHCPTSWEPFPSSFHAESESRGDSTTLEEILVSLKRTISTGRICFCFYCSDHACSLQWPKTCAVQ